MIGATSPQGVTKRGTEEKHGRKKNVNIVEIRVVSVETVPSRLWFAPSPQKMHRHAAPLSVRMQQCLAEHLPEFAVQQFHKHVLSGKPTTPMEERCALEALQQFETSRWVQSGRLLRLIAADKGLDPDTGEYVSSVPTQSSHNVVADGGVVPASDVARRLAVPPSPSAKHPAWSVQVREQTPEELHEIRIQRDLQVLRCAVHLWNPGRAAAVVKSFAMSELQRLVNDVHLRRHVLPWPMASLMELLTPACTLLSSQVTPTLEQLQQCRDRTILGEGVLMDALSELDRRTPTLTPLNALSYLTTVCPNIDEVFLSSLARSLHFRCVVRCSADSGNDDPQSLPEFLTRHRMSNVFPRVQSHSRADPLARAAHIARRTVRADVSQGVVVPDAEFIATQFNRLTSLSQHREVLVCFSVLVKLVRLASPESDDWRRFRVQRNLWQLLNSITTDGHATCSVHRLQSPLTAESNDDLEPVTNYGGVTFLGLLDELAIRQYMTERGNGGVWRSNTSRNGPKDDDLVSDKDAVACCAKYIERFRHPCALTEPRDSTDGSEAGASLPPALAAILQDFGVGRKSARSRVHLGNVVVLSRDTDIQSAALQMGVKVQA